MANAKTVKDENVDYPRSQDKGPIYEWFSENRTNANRLKVLPDPDAEILYFGEKEKELKEGDIVEAIFDGYAEKKEENYRFGVFVKLPGGKKALMYKNNASRWDVMDYYEGKTFNVKITEIKEIKNRKQYSVTDMF